jgi:hypothetical protein
MRIRKRNNGIKITWKTIYPPLRYLTLHRVFLSLLFLVFVYSFVLYVGDGLSRVTLRRVWVWAPRNTIFTASQYTGLCGTSVFPFHSIIFYTGSCCSSHHFLFTHIFLIYT